MPQFKESYLERYKILLGDELEIFKEAILKPLPISIRVNTIKISKEAFLKRAEERKWKLQQVPFFEDGFIFKERVYALGNTLEHFLGYIYMQEVASMIPPIVLNPNENESVLDMAAAPGSKTTQMAAMMNNKGIILANEKQRDRLPALRMNLQRCGVINTAICHKDGINLSKMELQFDKILLDAPCSGTGAIMKSPSTLNTWSERTSINMSTIQKGLIKSAYQILKPRGVLVYSTCSLEPEEDELVIDYAVNKFGFKVEKFDLKDFKLREGINFWNGKELNPEVKNSKRVYPQDNGTEGFFIAKLRKM